MQTTEQADLAQRLLDNDEQVLDDILRQWGPAIMLVLSRRYQHVLREADIEDVMSIGLFRLWTSRQRFDKRKASLRVWLYRIVENAARDVLRHGWHKARQLEVHADVALLGTVEFTAVQGDGQATGSGRYQVASDAAPTCLQLDLRDIVADLPEKQKYIVMADAASQNGVACSQLLGDELCVPAGTIRVYRKRAMDRIRQELSRRGHDVPGQK